MRPNFLELMEMQKTVNRKVNVRLAENDRQAPSAMDYVLAMTVEVAEFVNVCGTWKWWKFSHKKDQAKILDELADVMAFFLSFLILIEDTVREDDIDVYLEEVIENYMNGELHQLYSLYGNNHQMPEDIRVDTIQMMGLCIAIAAKELDIEWRDIEDAYLKKSAINIKRQEESY